jgi:hypothetical protein
MFPVAVILTLDVSATDLTASFFDPSEPLDIASILRLKPYWVDYPGQEKMAEHSPRPELETRRASDSVANMGTQTEEEQAPERPSTTLARTRGLGRDRQLTQRPPAGERQIVRGPDEVVGTTDHPHDRGGAPAVRLDMDLDVDIKLQARIKGDIELSIL